MGDLNLILFISFAAPIIMAIAVCRGKSRTLLLFLLLGTAACLFCSEISGLILRKIPCDSVYFTNNVTPLIEEVCKALPILIYAFLFSPKKQTLLECAVLVGVGFAVQENALILAGNVNRISIPIALIRGFGTGMMHVICSLAVGYGMTFVHKKRKLFYTGTAALLSVSVIYHSIYNTLVQSQYQVVGFIMPLLTFLPLIIVLGKKNVL